MSCVNQHTINVSASAARLFPTAPFGEGSVDNRRRLRRPGSEKGFGSKLVGGIVRVGKFSIMFLLSLQFIEGTSVRQKQLMITRDLRIDKFNTVLVQR
jgi:hypothetical protein